MRCKTCTYPLWRLKSRQCPECGSAFKPSDFEFIRNSVKFCCPHCNQVYFGDDPHGRLWPVEFDCVACGRHIHQDEMVLTPATGLEEERTEARKMPWLQRRVIGRRRAWLRTVGMALTAPGELIESTPDESSLVDAAKFWILTQSLIWIVAAIPLWVMIGFGVVAAAAGGGRGGVGSVAGPLALTLGGIFASGLVGTFVSTVVFGLIAHAILFLTGRTQAGLRRTLQAMAYSSGANVLTAIPCLGAYLGWIWWLISATIMVRAGHRVRAWRAVVAVIGPVAAAIALFVAGYAMFVYVALKRAGPAIASANITLTGSAPAAQRAAALAKALAARSDGVGAGSRPPQFHVAELIAEGSVEAGWLIDSTAGAGGGGGRAVDKVKINGMPLVDFVAAPMSKKRSVAREASDQLASDTVAYRFGDFVFTHTKRDRLSIAEHPSAAKLWVFIEWPAVTPSRPSLPSVVQIGLNDGSVKEIDLASVAEALREQNALRAELGLPALPHPSTFDPPSTPSPTGSPDETSPRDPAVPVEGGADPD